MNLQKTIHTISLVFGAMILVVGLGACAESATPTGIPVVPTPTPSRILTATPLLPQTPLPTRTPEPTRTLYPIPTPPVNGQFIDFSPNKNRTGWVGTKSSGIGLHDPNLQAGTWRGESFASILQFDLRSLAPNSKIVFAALELVGRRSVDSQVSGEGILDLLDSNNIEPADLDYNALKKLPALSSVGSLHARDIGEGSKNRFVFNERNLALVEDQLSNGWITLRLSANLNGNDTLFTWNTGSAGGEPVLYIVAIPGSFTVIKPSPPPPNVFAAATIVMEQTLRAKAYGTPTLLARIYVTATPAPSVGLVVITLMPTPDSPIKQTATAVYATAVAATTGTFTPFPLNWVTVTPRPLLIPRELISPAPTPTPTTAPVDLIALAKKPMPSILYNKIMFLEASRANPNIWVMDPDGSNVQLLTDRQYFDIAKARDTFSPDGSRWVYQWPDGYGQMQLWVADLNFPNAPPVQISFAMRGQGVVFGQAWSPDGQSIAYTADTIARQELWVFTFPNIHKRLTYSSNWYWNQFPSWSPDGKQIVFSTDFGHDAQFSEIWVMNRDGSNWKKLGNGVWDSYSPVWVKWRR